MRSAPTTETSWRFPGCPEPPDWSLDWNWLCAERPAIAALHDCPQDPVHHAEGDVGTHTRRVCAELTGLEAWRRLDPRERSIVFAATLFHDVAKPLCTREDMGRITSRGHARRGASMARLALWKDDEPGGLPDTPLPVREVVVGLVRHHGLPLSWPRETDLARRLIESSYQCRPDWLALIAEADVRGRDCPDRAELLDRVALFRELAAEESCLDRPRSFASAHTRFLYFHGRNCCADEPAYDDRWGEVILMSGLPGAGKDTWVAQNAAGRPLISLDAIRRELGVSPRDAQGDVVEVARSRAKELLRSGTPFVWNATNITRQIRDSLVHLFASYRARVSIVYIEAPWTVLMRRNQMRSNCVPARVLVSLAGKLEIPSRIEAHDVTWFNACDRVGP
jgi:predicted kinase